MRHNRDTPTLLLGSAKPTCASPPHSDVEPKFRILSRSERMAWRRELHGNASLRNERDTNATRGAGSTETQDFVGRVYFISAKEGGPFKVGWSKEPRRRLKELQTAHHQELRIYGCIPGQPELEGQIHNEIAGAHIRGEWFEREAVLKWIEAWEQSPDTWGALGYEIAPFTGEAA